MIYKAKSAGKRLYKRYFSAVILSFLPAFSILLILSGVEYLLRTFFCVPNALYYSYINQNADSVLLTGVFALFRLCLFWPVFFGSVKSVFCLPENPDVLYYFSTFGLFFKSAWFRIKLIFFTLIYFSVSFLPFFSFNIIKTTGSGVTVFRIFLIVLGVLFFLLLEMKNLNRLYCFTTGQSLKNRPKGLSLLVFLLSYSLWILPCILILPAVFIIPYLFCGLKYMEKPVP